MKVLYMTNLPAPYRVKFFEELGRKCDLTVLYERRSALDRDKTWIASHEFTYKEIFLDCREVGSDNSISLSTIKYLKDKTYDKIVIGMYSTYTAMIAIVYMRLHGIKFWISTDGGFVKEESKSKFLLKKFLISSAVGWLSTGKTATDYLIHYGAVNDRCHVYPFTSMQKKDIQEKPISYNEKKQYRKKLQMQEGKIVLSVGQFIPRKGYDILIKAFKTIDESVGLYIVGGVPTEEYIKLKGEKINIHFVNFMSKSELAEYYNSADLFVLPTREDVWGLVINEAMGYGLPIVASSKCMAAVEMINSPRLGVLIKDNENPSIWKENILSALNVPDRFSHTDILDCASKYTIENMAEETYAILSEWS